MRTTTSDPGTGAARRAGADGGGLLRVGLHLLLAALPLLAISAHVFGLVRMQLSAALLVVPLATALIAWSLFAPHSGDRVLAHGFVWGMIGTAIYDVFRLDTVYMLHWWADFIPTMGTWITGDDGNKVLGAIVGYLWRYPGDGGGIGITFFALASAVGLHQRSRGVVVGTAVAFAVFPVWAGLIGTVALASRGQTMMFPITPTTLTLSLIGHLIFGLIMGLGFWHSRAVQVHWPWAPLTGSSPMLALPGSGSTPTGSHAAAAGPATFVAPDAWSAAPTRSSGPRGVDSVPSAPVPTVAGGPRPADSVPSTPVPVSGSAVPPPPGPTWTPSGPIPAMAHAPRPADSVHEAPAMPDAPRSGPVPTWTPSGPMPATPHEPRPADSVPSTPVPTVAGGPRPADQAHQASTPTGDDAASSHPAPSLPHPRDRGTPPRGVARTATPASGQSLDPHTWELWQRQIGTTVRGRRTHRARR